jgi:hypothetical protein
MEVYLFLLSRGRDSIQDQDVKDKENSSRGQTSEHKTRIVMESFIQTLQEQRYIESTS